MATSIAKTNTVCQVCGGKIVARASTITYAPNIKGSARHSGCYGKTDCFDAWGNPLGEKPAPSGNGKTVEFTEEETMYIFGETEDAPAVKQPAPPVNSQPTSLDPMAQMMANSLAPYLEGLLKGKVDENTVRRLIKEVATQKSQEELKIQEEAIAKAVKEAIEERGLVTISVKQLNGSVTKLEGLQHKDTPFLPARSYRLRQVNSGEEVRGGNQDRGSPRRPAVLLHQLESTVVTNPYRGLQGSERRRHHHSVHRCLRVRRRVLRR